MKTAMMIEVKILTKLTGFHRDIALWEASFFEEGCKGRLVLLQKLTKIDLQ